MGHTPQDSIGGVLISLPRPWARRWINHLSLWCMASVTPDLRLPSQPQSITASWLVPNYTAWWWRSMCVNNFPKVVTWKWNDRESNLRPFVSRANTLTITSPDHLSKTGHHECSSSKLWLPPVLWRRFEDSLASICILIHSCQMPKSETTGLNNGWNIN